jgi:2-polyprenyl-3-methyl-5-hydroxy-6-metoxy-1,4-benzoquinol methylase
LFYAIMVLVFLPVTQSLLLGAVMYTNFAYIYDQLMYDVNYKQWADYLERIFKRYSLDPHLVLDLGCGTGNLCVEMAQRGYEMIGVDLSEDMLSCAREKAGQTGSDILFLNQDMTDFELYGTVDAIVCLMDSLNYVTRKQDVQRLFKLVQNYLNPEGLFIFDINSSYKLKEVLGNNVFYEIGDEITYIWQNSYEERKKLCTFDLTFFIRKGSSYSRYDEVHHERAYSADELLQMAKKAGLEQLGIFHEFTCQNPDETSQRIFFVFRKGNF